MHKNELLFKIESMLPLLSKTEQQLGHFVLDHKEEILTMSIKELSVQSKVSEASIIRFTRKLDLHGYTEFKLTMSANLAHDEIRPVPVDVTSNDNGLEIYRNIASFTKHSIDATSQTLVQKDLDAAIDLIAKTYKSGHHIFLSGFGASAILVKEFQIKLIRLGIPVIYHEDIHLQLEASLRMTKTDILICFSSFGNSTQTHQLIEIANQRKTKVLVITQYGNERLAKKADITLFTSSIENQFQLSSQTSIIVQSLIIDTIFLGLALKDLDHIQKDVKATKETFAKLGYYI